MPQTAHSKQTCSNTHVSLDGGVSSAVVVILESALLSKDGTRAAALALGFEEEESAAKVGPISSSRRANKSWWNRPNFSI